MAAFRALRFAKEFAAGDEKSKRLSDGPSIARVRYLGTRRRAERADLRSQNGNKEGEQRGAESALLDARSHLRGAIRAGRWMER